MNLNEGSADRLGSAVILNINMVSLYEEKFIRTLYEVCVCLMAHLISFICFSTFSYRKVVSNNCTAGVSAEYTARRQHCPIQAPKGLHLVTSEGSLTAVLGTNVTFLVFLEEVSCIQCFP